MNIRSWPIGLLRLATTGLLLISTARASQNDRDYRMGDDPAEAASDGNPITGTTFDSAGQPMSNQLHDLVAVGSPVYRAYTGRPDGNNSLGVELNGSGQYLHSARVGLPDTTVSSVLSTTLNYSGIVDRGLQFWVRPAATNAQTLVMDTNQHGARINSDGNFSMRYAGADYDSSTPVSAGTWYHVMVVRPNGPDNGSRMYVNGIAVTAAPGGYDGADTAELVVGSNTAGDDDPIAGEGFTGGTEEYFSGIIDDLKIFVIGQSNEFINTSPPVVEPGVDFGDFDFAADNDYAAFTLTGVAGDLDGNGSFQSADRTAFINGWMHEQVINDVRVGDLNTYAAGDLNFDGITDIQDLAAFQKLLPVAGLAQITSAELSAVPEPSTVWLLAMATTLAPATRRRRRR